VTEDRSAAGTGRSLSGVGPKDWVFVQGPGKWVLEAGPLGEERISEMKQLYRYLPGLMLAMAMSSATFGQVVQVAVKARGSL